MNPSGVTRQLLCAAMLSAAASACAKVDAAPQSVQVDMSNVDLHVATDVTLHVRQLRGRFVPVARQIPYLDDTHSYLVAIDTGEISLDLASLNTLLVRSLGGDGSNLDKLQVSFEQDGTLGQRGVIDSAINVPFSAKAVVSATPDGRIRVSPQSVRSLGVPMKPVMNLFRMKLDDLVTIAPGRGIVTDGDDLLLDPGKLLPAPSIQGRVTAVRIERNQLVQTFGSGGGASVAGRPLSRNHIYWRGGQLSFGKLTMTDTDLELVDADPSDPFDFSVSDWDAQLVAGYSKTLPNRGLMAHMPDYNDIKPARTSSARPSSARQDARE
jgi:hypothetical protein